MVKAAWDPWKDGLTQEDDDDDDDTDDDDGPFAEAINKCRSSHASLLHIEEHRAIARDRASTWQRFLMLLQSLKGGNFRPAYRQLIAMSLIISLRASSAASMYDHKYDSDSFLIAIDNCSSRCITNNMADFITPPVQVNVKVTGIGGSVVATHKGTVRWSIEDDNGRRHTWLISDTYFNESTPYRLLSPQHWAQTQQDGRGTWAATYYDAVEMFWQDNRFRRSIPLSAGSNIALLRSAPGFDKMQAFCMEIHDVEHPDIPIDEAELLALPTVTDDEASDTEAESDTEDDLLGAPASRRHPDLPDEAFDEPEKASVFQKHMTAAFESGTDMSKVRQRAIVENDEVHYSDKKAELLSWHYRLGHLSFARLKKLAERGDLPKYLRDVKPPKCASCMYGKATR
jgi:GAG-pre-integrase domain